MRTVAVHIRTLLVTAHDMAVTLLAERLTVHGGSFTFLPEERPSALLDLHLRSDLPEGVRLAGRIPVASVHLEGDRLRFDLDGGCCVYDKAVCAEDLLQFACSSIPNEPVDYEAACKTFKRLDGVYRVRGDEIRFDAENRTISCMGSVMKGTEACRKVLWIVSMLDDPERTRTVDEIMTLFYDESGIGLPF